MRATIYTTNDYGEYRCKTIPHGTTLSGITTAVTAEDIFTGFMGFGVAITGPTLPATICLKWNQMRVKKFYGTFIQKTV